MRRMAVMCETRRSEVKETTQDSHRCLACDSVWASTTKNVLNSSIERDCKWTQFSVVEVWRSATSVIFGSG